MSAGNAQTEWARLLLGSLARAGVETVVASPGSRSTPFLAAALAHPGLEVIDVLDERSAGYFALGLGKATGRPALLLSTSGTAAANYLPAVVEAGMAHVPLLVLTADRPPELAACGANQTIDQLKLFGSHARRFFELGTADPAPAALRGVRRIAAQAVLAARYPEPGAVHLNARARKPLEPQGATSEEERGLVAAVDGLLAGPIARPHLPRLVPAAAAVRQLAAACAAAERGLLVCGPAPLDHAPLLPGVAELAARTGFPVLAEATSQMRFRKGLAAAPTFVDAFDALLRSPGFRARHRPDLILQLGTAPTSKGWEDFVAEHAGCPRWVIAPHGWHDPWNSAGEMLSADLGETLEALLEELAEPGRSSTPSAGPWRAAWEAAERAAWNAVDAVLGEDGEALSEGAVARSTAAALPDGGLLALGNSLPVRQVDGYCRGAEIGVQVWSQRGASGIDGVVSAAAGAVRALGKPAALLVGDLSFLHDAAGLALLRRLQVPCAVVVVQNQGGRIFEQLPMASHPAAGGAAFDHWTTPHRLSFSHLAAMYGLGYTRPTTGEELRTALAEALRGAGGTVVEAVVPPHGAAAQNRRLWRRVEEAVGSLGS